MEADAKARKELHGFRRWYKCTLLCEKCLAQNMFPKADAAMSYMNFSEQAPWRLTQMSHSVFVDYERRFGFLSPWMSLLGLTLDQIWRDFMHTLHLGILRDFTASLIVFWVMNGSLESWLQNERDILSDGKPDALRLLFLDFETYMSDAGLHGEKP
eukprot:1376082-Pyramimonas_sp.AAC.1